MTEFLTISGTNLRKQKFPFRPKFMKYLLETSDAEIMQKFHRCCKQLYNLAPYFILDSIELEHEKLRMENEKYDDCLNLQEDQNSEIDNFLYGTDNIWLTKSVTIKDSQFPSRCKIVRCSATKISTTKLLYKTFKILTKSGNVETLTFDRICNSDGSAVPLEDILVHVPRISSLQIGKCRVTPQTMTKLSEIPWEQKIRKVFVDNFDFDVNEMENCDPDEELFIKFFKVCFSEVF